MAKDRFGYGTEENSSEEEVNQMAELFKKNTSAWLRLTELPTAFDKRRRDWKGATEEFMKNEDYIKFVKAQTPREKYEAIKDSLHPVFKDTYTEEQVMDEIMSRF